MWVTNCTFNIRKSTTYKTKVMVHTVQFWRIKFYFIADDDGHPSSPEMQLQALKKKKRDEEEEYLQRKCATSRLKHKEMIEDKVKVRNQQASTSIFGRMPFSPSNKASSNANSNPTNRRFNKTAREKQRYFALSKQRRSPNVWTIDLQG